MLVNFDKAAAEIQFLQMGEPELNSDLGGAESQAVTLDSEDLQVREKLSMRNKSHHRILDCVGMKRK